MNKTIRNLQAQIEEQKEIVKTCTAEGEGRDLDKAEAALNKLDELTRELAIETRAAEAVKAQAPAGDPDPAGKVDGFKMIAKMMHKRALDEKEKAALVTGANDDNGVTYLVPEDVKAEINELRKTYVSAKHLVYVDTTDALAGSVNYEEGVPTGLIDFEDGNDISEEDDVKFGLRRFAIKWKGKLIPVSRILLGSAKANLMNYLDRWFVKNAILSENAAIFTTLKAGYNSGTPKAVVGWKELKKSITKDLDPSCKLDGVIITNQSGFACLDEEEFADGHPVLKDNPTHVTEKMFQSLPIYVFPDAQLPNIDETHFPMIYGSTKAGATFVEHENLEFAISEHVFFKKNQNCLRVIEGFDVMSTDASAYIYGSFSASV